MKMVIGNENEEERNEYEEERNENEVIINRSTECYVCIRHNIFFQWVKERRNQNE